MLNYSKALRNYIGVWSKSFLHALLTAPLCEATMEIFSHCANTNFAAFLLQTGGSPASLSTQQTLSFLITLPFLCAFPHSLLYMPSAENRSSNIKLELHTTWHKQTQKSRQNKLSHFCIICALISESKTLLLTKLWNYIASFMIYDGTFSKQSLSNSHPKPALPCLGLSCTWKKVPWDSSSPVS